MNLLNTTTLEDGRKAIVLRTSDRGTFKRCRRQWHWSSHLKMNLGSKHLAPALWFGSGVHFALEDFYGYRRFERLSIAFRAYCIATSKQHLKSLPDNAQELLALGVKLLDYYQDDWLTLRPDYATYVVDGVPQVEVTFNIIVPEEELPPLLKEYLHAQGAEVLLYRGTIDRVAIDEYGRLWIVEYKTAANAEHLHYQTDPQISSYVWAGTQLYQQPIAGVIYVQFVKKMPKEPPILQSGQISTAANLNTSSILYKRAVERFYGTMGKAPEKYSQKLAELMSKEDEHTDRYIQRALVDRSAHTSQMEGAKILLEAEDILNPNLPMYPSPGRDCPRYCSFIAPCIAFDDGSDWEHLLESNYSAKPHDFDGYWRSRLPEASRLAAALGVGEPDLGGIQERLQKLSEEEQNEVFRGQADVLVDFSF